MGQTTAAGYAECVVQGLAPLRVAIETHLQHNHFPPVGAIWVQPCLDAIAAANEDDFDRLVMGAHGRTLPAFKVLEGLHLAPFIGLEG